MRLMHVSLLIAAVAYYFFLDEKVTKNQDEKILLRTGPLPVGPGFSSGRRSSLTIYPHVFEIYNTTDRRELINSMKKS